MAYRPHGQAIVDPDNPNAFAICDRCGAQYNHVDLRWQYQWAGNKLYNKRVLVCPNRCLDEPSAFLKTVTLPADPPVVHNARPEYYTIDEAGSFAPNQYLHSPSGAILNGLDGQPILRA